jgi:T-complex protein 1 subunit theta
MGSAGLPYGLQAMLKDGHKHLSGLDEAVYKNIDACKQFAQICKSSMGPRGEWSMQKHYESLVG